ncbi:hypothetical protein SmJEL517_g00568 [Synchytrium microbalum]|uniref:Cytochrome b5 heme-binding domain-containing protein n=1 Tax=Synchytrium microbalum TaxID=1806994 RepID=A0A507C8U1_9FUNG|nr:uncharacterized protein SmJEL517_g00568 [Synchytrium microbalum]TPX37477.1 hypothetical protein SmJEL517_g00568 [Synchytrium microbalum]
MATAAYLAPSNGKKFTLQEVAKHNTEDNAWVIINDRAGGKRILLSVAGKDATAQFANFHNVAAVLATKANALYIGDLDQAHKEAPKPKGELFGELIPYGDPSWYQGWKTPYYKESHKRLRDYMRDIVDTHLIPYNDVWEADGQIPKSVYKLFGELGLLTAFTGVKPWPSSYIDTPPPVGIKPEEWDAFHWMICLDELARAYSPARQQLTLGPSIALPAIIGKICFGNDFQRKEIMPQVMSGNKTVCLCISEPYAGSDVANITTTAVKTADGKHYIVNGEKKWITCGMQGDYFVTACRTGPPGSGANGISVLIVERGPGLKTRSLPTQQGTAAGTAYVTYDNVKVPVQNLLGEENKGFKVLMNNFNKERISIAINASRNARVCVEVAMKYANKRKTFGQYLIEHGVIRNKARQRFGHMSRMVEATHAWIELVIYQWDNMTPAESNLKLGGSIALLKAQCTQTLELCAREASQIMGGIAYTKGGQGGIIERLYRSVRGAAIPGGSEEIMLDFGVRQGLKTARALGAKI